MAFRWDTRHLSPQVQQIISKREDTDRFMKGNLRLERESKKKIIYPIAIFMRLGIDTYSRLNGVETLKQYENFCGINKSVWFSTDSLATGMSEKKRTEFLNEINSGNTVEVFFAIGKSGGGNNDIQYKAEVIDIKSYAEGIGSPEKTLTPDIWKDAKKKIWIKIINLMPTGLKAEDFIVQRSKNVLAKSIEKSQYHFGYIERK